MDAKSTVAVRGAIGLGWVIAASLLMGWFGRAALSNGWFDTIDSRGGAADPSSAMARLFDLLAQTATTKGVIVCSILMVIILLVRRLYTESAVFFGAALTAAIAQSVLKDWVGRMRPGDLAMMESGSFPSGQAFVSVAAYGLFALLLARSLRSNSARLTIGVVAVVFLLLISYGRVVLGAHYVSDVLAGNLLGLVWLIVGQWVLAGSQAREHMPSTKAATTRG